MFHGVFERFPLLRLACLEAGAGWAPYFFARLDEEYEHRGAIEAPEVSRPPSDYIRRGQLYFAFEPEEPLLPHIVDHIGQDYFIYATDYPHWDNSFPESLRAMQRREDLSDEAKGKLLGDNARRLYRLSA